MKKKILSLAIVLAVILAAMLGLSGKVSGWYYGDKYTSGDYEYGVEDGKAIITDYLGEPGKVTIPSKIDGYTVTKIASEAFGSEDGITYVVIPSSVNYIESYAFDYVSTLQTAEIRNPYCAIESYAFYDVSDSFKIKADEGSTVQDYAKSYEYKFEAIDTHTLVNRKVVKATPTTDGYIQDTCKTCGKVTTIKIYKMSNIKLSQSSCIYNGKTRTPSVIAKDSLGRTLPSSCYTVKYSSGRKNVGTYSVTITLKGEKHTGSITKKFTIKKRAMKKSNTKIANTIYTGKAKYPTVKWSGIKLKNGRDYTISKISKNKKIGTANVTLKMKGNYSGTVKTTFKIVPGKTKISFKKRDTSSITVKWTKVKGASGYKVYRWNGNKYAYYKTTSSTSMRVKRAKSTYTYVDLCVKAYKKVGKTTYYGEPKYYYNCVKPARLGYSVSSSNIGKIRINFTMKSNEYKNVQVQICLNKSFNNEKYDVQNFYTYAYAYYGSKYVEYYNLRSDKYYYVRCREYTYSAAGSPIYGSWGKVKKVYVQ